MFNIKDKVKYTKGTTLLEIMVVISIFVVISGVTVFNYGQFNSSMSTQNLVDDIALSVRRAQSYAIGVRGVGEEFIGGYGVHFSTKSLVANKEYEGSNKSFVVFAEMGVGEAAKNFKYNYPSSYSGCGTPVINNECLEVLKILSIDEISVIRLYGGNSTLLATLNSSTPNATLDILFYRPDPEPDFCYRLVSTNIGCSILPNDIVYTEIDVSNNVGGVLTTRTIKISNSGQISTSE